MPLLAISWDNANRRKLEPFFWLRHNARLTIVIKVLMAPDHPADGSLSRLRSELNQSGIEFLYTDLETALTLAQIACSASRGSEKRERNTSNARRAYDTIVHLAPRISATPEQARELDEKLGRLRSALQDLGETL